MMREAKVAGKQKFTLEFEIKCSPRILYNYLSTASGLEGWFADKVVVDGENFIFHWGHEQQSAMIVAKKENKMIQYHWMDGDKADHSFFQFDIVQDDLTGDVALVVTDFAAEDEKEENIRLWNSEIHDLMHLIGS